jgi:DNA replication protein DnaC
MLTEPTISKLHALKMKIFAQRLQEQNLNSDILNYSFDDRLGILVDAEYDHKKNNQLLRLMHQADYPDINACVEGIEFHSDRKLDKSQINRLATCEYINKYLNLIILGPTGAGKTYIATSLGVSANRNFISVKYYRLPDLLAKISTALIKGTYEKIFKQLKSVKVLIIDDWLLYPFKDNDLKEIFEIIEVRYMKSSTIFCSQINLTGWHEKLGGSALSEALLDRIIHNAYKIEIHNEISMRERKGVDFCCSNRL